MRITTGMTQRSTLADLNRINERVTKAQQQASSNRQISRPSDDPYDAARALQLRESLAGVKQYQRNIKDGQGWQETAEEAMSSITDSAQRARELLVQGTSDTTDPASRESMQRVAAEKIRPSSSIGRWREHDQAELDTLHDIAGEALRKFGYE